MKKDTWPVILLWVVALAIAALAFYFGFVQAAVAAARLASAVIAAAAIIIGAILNYVFAMNRQLTIMQRQMMRTNYEQLVTMIGKYVQSPSTKSDEFDTIHLFSWIVASPQVVKATQELMKQAKDKSGIVDEETLRTLLLAMRHDVGLLSDSLKGQEIPVFKPKTSGGVGSKPTGTP